MDGFSGGAWRTTGRAEIYVGGQWRPIFRGEAYRAAAWTSVLALASPLSVAAPDAYGDNTNETVTSAVVTATPLGGFAPYSYSWSVISGGAVPLSPTMASTAFQQAVPKGSPQVSTARVTVTDAAGKTASTTITVTLSRTPKTPGETN